MSSWKIGLSVQPEAMKILVEGPEGDLLRARLPPNPAHPRALITLLEGLSLWAGTPLRAVVSVSGTCPPRCGEGLFDFGGDALYGAGPLIAFDNLPTRPTRCRIRGLGSFRALHGRVRGGA